MSKLMSKKEMKRAIKENKIEPQFVVNSPEGEAVSSVYSFPTASGRNILVPGSGVMSKEEKLHLRYIKEVISNWTDEDLLLLFEDKEEGLKFINTDEIPLLDIHNRLNSTEDMKYYNLFANMVTKYFYSDVVEDSVFLTTAIAKLKDGTLGNIMIEQGTNKVFTYTWDEECPRLVVPVSSALTPTAQIATYIINDIYFRLQLLQNPEEDGHIQSYRSFLVPMVETAELLIKDGEIKPEQEV